MGRGMGGGNRGGVPGENPRLQSVPRRDMNPYPLTAMVTSGVSYYRTPVMKQSF